ncbi:MAG TPA: tyrosine-type recombinase/integrase [Gemmataceae bacterium]|nr:tyrosine-type recombinase/integrase [Gemmataceae bacterium]
MPRRNHVPSYRLHKQSGLTVVSLTDAITGKRQDHLLGPHGTPGSRAEYGRIIAEWEARGRRLNVVAPIDLTVAELLVRFLAHSKTYYLDPGTKEPSTEYDEFDRAVVPLTHAYPHLGAAEFGAAHLKVVRDMMIALGWSRTTINQRVRRIRHVWKWATGEGLIPASAWYGLCVVRGLQAGRSAARESSPRQPVADAVVDATLPHLTRHVRGLIQFLRLTGCRPAEACRLRMCEVDTSGAVWVYSPARHKCAWRGHTRHIGIGPRAQALLREFIAGLPADDFVFSSRRQSEERYIAMRAARMTPVQQSQACRRKRKPKKQPGEHYTPMSVGQAVRLACKKARVPTWCPYQLRHAAGARARRAGGLDAAQALLGHRTVGMTEHYSKLTIDDVVKVAAQVA